MKIAIEIILLITVTTEAATRLHDGSRLCRKAKVFRKNRSYLYDYEGRVENGIKGTSENSTKMRITADIQIDHVNGCEYAMHMKNVKFEETVNKAGIDSSSPESVSIAEALERFPVRFIIDHGIIKEIRPVLKERQINLLNIKRGALSALQVKWSKKKSAFETDVSGVCEVAYKFVKHKDGTKKVIKLKNVADCKNRWMAHSNIESIQYKQMSSVYDAKSSCSFALGKKNEIQETVCIEYYLMKPFSTSFGAGSYTNISKRLSLRKILRIENKRTDYLEFYPTTLLFGNKHEENMKSSDDTAAVKLLHILVKDSGKQTLPSTSGLFVEFLFALRLISESGFGIFLQNVESCFSSSNCDQEKIASYWSFLLEGLAQCGTTACVNVLGGLMASKRIPTEKMDNLIAALNFIPEPSPAMLNTAMGIYKSTENPTAILLLGTLMHKLCKHRPAECQGRGLIRSVLTEAEFFIIRLLGNDCRLQSKERNEQMYYALKAIGNAGRPSRMKNVIMDCVQHGTSTKISIAALHALRRMPRDSEVAEVLRMIMIDRNADSEKRMEAFLSLMEDAVEDDILLSVDMVNDEREAKQMRSFMSSYLTSMAKNRNPSKARHVSFLKKSLAKRNMTKFNSSASRFSKFFDKSMFIDFGDFGSGFNCYSIFHPESFIPRTVKLGFNAQILGHSVNLVEIRARMEGMENPIVKLLGETGLFSTTYLEKIFEIPKEVDEKEERQRRNVEKESIWSKLKKLDKKVNMKESKPEIDVTVSVFGNEIRMFKLNDIPFLNGELEKLNILKSLYLLTKGKTATLRRNLLFLEGSYVVPTVLGFPLSFQVNGSAAVSLHLDGKVKVNNLILGPKTVHLEGSMLPSASLDVSGKVTVDGYFSKVGMRLHSKTYASNSIAGRINYKKGKELEAHVNVPETHVDLFNYTHEIFHVVGPKEVKITGSKRRTKLNICTDEIYNISKYFGVDVCADLSFPVAYQNLDSPYYPLTGPAHVHFRMHKRDHSLKHYHLKIVQENDLLQVAFGTPGANDPRLSKTNLGIRPNGRKGVIGATFGNTNRGLLLRYEYDNKTNGLEAELRSNVTDGGLILSARYINKTDPATLDLRMGLELQVSSEYMKAKTHLYFLDTYGYWGFTWLIDYGNTLMNTELKVAYNPQTIFVKLNYGNNSFALQLVPSFPEITFDLQISWQSKVLNLTMKTDVNQRTIDIVANTTSQSYGAYAGWKGRQGFQQFLIRINSRKTFYKWLTELDYKAKDKIMKSHIIFQGRKYGIACQMDRKQFILGAVGFPATFRVQLMDTFHTKGVNVSWGVGSHSGQLIFNYERISKLGLRSICTRASIMEISNGFCLNFLEKGQQRVIELVANASNIKMYTKFSFVRRKWNKDSKHVSLPSMLGLQTQVNDAIVLDAQVTFHRGKYSSSVNLVLPQTKIALDLQIPNRKEFQEATNVAALLRLNYTALVDDYLMQISVGKSSKPGQKNSEICEEAKFIRKGKRSVDIMTYSHKYVLDGERQFPYSKREFCSIFGNRAHVYEEQWKRDRVSGRVSWEIKLVKANTTSQKTAYEHVNDVKKDFQMMKPMIHILGELNNISSKANVFLQRLEIDFFENKAGFNLDLKKRLFIINVKLLKFLLSLNVKFNQPDRYDILLEYSNKSLIQNRAEIVIAKGDQNGQWEITVHHPYIRKVVPMLKSVYGLEYRQYQARLLSLVLNVSNHLNISHEAKQKILERLADVTKRLFLNHNWSNIDVASQEWKGFARFVWSEMADQAIKRIFTSNKQIFQMSVSKMNDSVKDVLRVLSESTRDLIINAISLEKFQRSGKGKELLKTFESSMSRLKELSTFKPSIMNGLRKAVIMLNVSKETEQEVSKLVKNYEDSKEITQNQLFQLPVAISNLLVKEMLKRRVNSLLKVLRFNVKMYSKPKRQAELLQTFDKVERTLGSLKFDGKESWNQNIDKVMNVLLQTSMSLEVVREAFADRVFEESKELGLPRPVTKAVMQFAHTFRYADLHLGIVEHILQELNLTRRYPVLGVKIFGAEIRSLLFFAKEIVKDEKTDVAVKQKFARFIKSRNMNELVSSLLELTVIKSNTSKEVFTLLENILTHRDVTAHGRSSYFNPSQVLTINEVVTKLIHHFISTPATGSIIHSLLRHPSRPSNATQRLNIIFDSFLASANFPDFLKVSFVETVKELMSSQESRSILNKLFKNQNDARIFDGLPSIDKLNQLLSRKQNSLTLAKSSLLEYLNKIYSMIPHPWQSRMYPILKTFDSTIKRVDEVDLIQNTTKVLFHIMDRVSSAAYNYVSKNLSADIVEDFHAALKDFLPKVAIGNSSVVELAARTLRLIKQKIRFGLRITAQVFPAQVEKVERSYLAKKGILLEQMYMDLLRTNLTSPGYWVEKMMAKLGERVLEEISNATDRFSIGAGLVNLLKLVNNLNMTNLDSVVKSYEQLKSTKHSNWAAPVVLSHLKDAIKTFGRMQIGNQTVNRHAMPMVLDFNNLLPQVIKETKMLDKVIESVFKNSTRNLRRLRSKMQNALKTILGDMKYGFTSWPKIASFISDLTVPVLSTTRKMLDVEFKRQNNGRNVLRMLVKVITKFDRLNFTSEILEFIERTSDRPLEESLQIFLRKGGATFVETEKFVIKKLNDIEKTILNGQKELRNILKKMKKFLSIKAGQPLHKLAHKSTKHSYNYITSSLTNSSLLTYVKSELSSMATYQLLTETVIAAMRNASDAFYRMLYSLNPDTVQQWAQAEVPPMIRNATMGLTRGIVAFLKLIDIGKEVAFRNVFLKDPKAYVYNLPSFVATRLQTIFEDTKPKLFLWFSEAERLTKQNIRNWKEFQKAKMGNLQSILERTLLEIRSLNNYTSSLSLMKENATKGILSNIKSEMKLLMNNLKDLLTPVNHSASENILQFLNATRYSKGGEKMMNPKFMSMSANKSLHKMAKEKFSFFEQSLTKNVTKSIRDARILMKKMKKAMMKIIDRGNETAVHLQNQINLKMKNLQRNLKIVENEVTRFVRMKQNSSALFIVPEVQQLKRIFTKLIGKENHVATFMHSESRNASLKLASVKAVPSKSALRPSIGAGQKMESHDSVDSLMAVKYWTKPFSPFKKKEWDWNWEIASKKNGLKPYVTMPFKSLRNWLDYVTKYFENQTMRYQSFVDKIDFNLNALAQGVYLKNFIEPLRRITSFATIPAPGETLQKMFERENVLEKATKILMPLPGSATFYGNRIFTYDGSYLYLPNLPKTDECAYLLSRDFRNRAFTFIYQKGQLKMYIGTTLVQLSRNGKVEITSFNDGRNIYTTDLPVATADTLIKTKGNRIEISSPFGLQISCNKDSFSCHYLVAGIYHNKTLGLFGSNNVEYADDFRLPNSRIANGVASFVNSWEVTGECDQLQQRDFRPTCKIPANPICYRLFRNRESALSRAFNSIRPLPYLLACQQETSKCSSKTRKNASIYCPIVSLYVKKAFLFGIKLDYPEECVSCENINGPGYGSKSVAALQNVDFVLLVRDTIHTKKALPNLKNVLSKLDGRFRSLNFNSRYTLVGFDGANHRFEPYIQTGNGEASGSLFDLIAALDNLELKRPIKTLNGLKAIQYAASLDLRPISTKIFMMLDTISVFTGSLKEMIETNNLLRGKGIILNVINKYKFKRNVIGKDSFNTRYHLKIPKGEQMRYLALHTADDYVPLVKESGGGIMTLKGLTSANEKWMKAFPISLWQIIHKQIEKDKKQCKSCKCHQHKDGYGEIQCVNSEKSDC